jgi:hypothetical protein
MRKKHGVYLNIKDCDGCESVSRKILERNLNIDGAALEVYARWKHIANQYNPQEFRDLSDLINEESDID